MKTGKILQLLFCVFVLWIVLVTLHNSINSFIIAIMERTSFLRDFIVILKKEDLRNFLLQIWLAQVTISTGSFAILTIVLSLFNKTYYGISTLRFISEKKWYWDGFFVLLLLNILNYFSAISLKIFVVELTFVISVILISYLLYKSIKWIAIPEHLEEEMKQNFIEQTKRALEIENNDFRRHNNN